MENEIEKLKYPIGRFVGKDDYTLHEVEEFIDSIRQFPERLRTAVHLLNEEELKTVYRPNGWTIKQVVHHVCDSHMNALLRFKLTLTEENPVIKPYREAAFANLQDYDLPIQTALNTIEGIHQHWVHLVTAMKPEDFERTYYHPEHEKSFNLYLALSTYDWHCKHHLGHINQAKKLF
jgi:hypothetical protein